MIRGRKEMIATKFCFYFETEQGENIVRCISIEGNNTSSHYARKEVDAHLRKHGIKIKKFIRETRKLITGEPLVPTKYGGMKKEY